MVRKANKSLKDWVAFIKKVQKEEKLSYPDAMKRAKVRKDKGEKWKIGGGIFTDETDETDKNGKIIPGKIDEEEFQNNKEQVTVFTGITKMAKDAANNFSNVIKGDIDNNPNKTDLTINEKPVNEEDPITKPNIPGLRSTTGGKKHKTSKNHKSAKNHKTSKKRHHTAKKHKAGRRKTCHKK